MRALAVILVLAILAAIAGNAAQPVAGADWADCLACHEVAGLDLPPLGDFRPAGLGAVLPRDCLECHEPIDVAGLRMDWTHPVRPVGAHLECTMCHAAVPHGKDTPPPMPQGDYNEEGCYECHATVSVERSLASAHGDDPRIRCLDCHPAHEPLSAALPAHLLPTGIRNEWLGSYDWYSSNELCLGCHPPAELLLRLDKGFVSLNTVNYHDVHVERGDVMCIECHQPHGSQHASLVRSRLLTGEILSFREDFDGGNCAVNCHGVDHDDWFYINYVF